MTDSVVSARGAPIDRTSAAEPGWSGGGWNQMRRTSGGRVTAAPGTAGGFRISGAGASQALAGAVHRGGGAMPRSGDVGPTMRPLTGIE